MKRSENVGLVVMGGASFAATFAAGMTYFSWQKPSHAGQPQAAAQTCTQRPDGTQSCEPARRGFTYYLFPSWGSSGSASASEAKRTSSAALTSNARASTSVSPSGTTRGGFGGTAQSGSFRVSAGG